MHFKTVMIFVILGAVYLHESEAAPKLGLIKAKLIAAKAPHVIAKVAVAKEVKVKTKIAAAKAVAAAKAAKIAALSIVTAPFKKAKKTIALKIGGLKALKAIKLAKIAKTAAILKNLKKSPIILPVPVALPIVKPLPVVKALPTLPTVPALPTLPSIPNLFNLPAPNLAQALGPIQGVISGAQKAIQSAGSTIPLISTLTNSFGSSEPKTAPITVTPAPVYRFVPEVGFSNYNKVSYHPQVEVEVPTVVSSAAVPAVVETVIPSVVETYIPHVAPTAQIAQVAPASVYGPPQQAVVPATQYGLPN